MKFATIRVDGGTRAVLVDGDELVDLGFGDLGQALRAPGGLAGAVQTNSADAKRWRTGELGDTAYAPVVPNPGKIVCVGLNYANHIREMGRELPEHPTLFGKYPEALIGADDPLVLPPESTDVDWEGELAVVIGSPVRRAGENEAAEAIAGFAVLNDVTMRDWQYRTPQWLQGKTFEATTPFGPWLVTPDELDGGVRPRLELTGLVDGEVVQKADTSDLVFDPVALVSYVSTILTLNPGDVIATGTPGGVGHARKPARYLTPGSLLTTRITGLGESTVRVLGLEPHGSGSGA